MSTYQNERTKAAIRLRQVEDELANAKSELQHQDSLSSTDRIQLQVARDNAISEQGQLSREQDRLDRLITWEKETSSAEATIKASRKKIAVAQKELAGLEKQQGKLAEKLSKVTGEIDGYRGQSQADEQAAASAYAAAMAADDAAAEQRALAQLDRVSEAAEGNERKIARLQTVATALEQELAKVVSAQTEAAQQLGVLEHEQMTAVRLRLASEWDKAAQSMIDLGARLAATARFGAGRSTVLDDLHIPLLSPEGPSSVNGFEVGRRSEQIGRDELAA